MKLPSQIELSSQYKKAYCLNKRKTTLVTVRLYYLTIKQDIVLKIINDRMFNSDSRTYTYSRSNIWQPSNVMKTFISMNNNYVLSEIVKNVSESVSSITLRGKESFIICFTEEYEANVIQYTIPSVVMLCWIHSSVNFIPVVTPVRKSSKIIIPAWTNKWIFPTLVKFWK